MPGGDGVPGCSPRGPEIAAGITRSFQILLDRQTPASVAWLPADTKWTPPKQAGTHENGILL
jgi:hypothetical protein